MKRPSILLAGAALLTLASGPVSAACIDEIASLSPGTTTGSVATTGNTAPARVSKDGSLAPMQSGQQAAAGQTTGSAGASGSTGQPATPGQGIAKDGSTMPLANNPGGGDKTVATSAQDAQAQQRGGQTASGQAQTTGGGSSGYHSPEMMAAIDKARTLQQQGNEAGCMQAIQDARRLQR
jgi:hypothetical protein